MAWICLKKEDFVTAMWSGGITTQLAISPEGALYGERNFLWRLSSAEVEHEHSEFTVLPDYLRLISVLEGSMDLKIGEGDRFTLPPLTVRSFDGGVPVESWGRCRDFNLMVRKEKGFGMVQCLSLASDSDCVLSFPAVTAPDCQNRDAAIYVADGAVSLPDEPLLGNRGDLLMHRKIQKDRVRVKSLAPSNIIAVLVMEL